MLNIGDNTGLYDVKGRCIHIGDWVLIKDDQSGVKWKSTVTYKQGMVTVNVYDAEQVSDNPKEWKHEHDWIHSRWWSTKIGYIPRHLTTTTFRPLVKIAGLPSESYQEILRKEHGYRHTYVDCQRLSEPESDQEGDQT